MMEIKQLVAFSHQNIHLNALGMQSSNGSCAQNGIANKSRLYK
jgi:hypothetical protein